MKRALILLLSFILLCSPLQTGPAFAETAIEVSSRFGYTIDPYYQPKGGSIVADALTGQILWAEDESTPWAPASVTKMMVLYQVYEAISRGEISESTLVTVTPDISELSTFYALSNNFLPIGEQYTIAELINLVVFPSSAGATLFLTHALGLDHAQMVERMNQTALELGMVNTHYYNAIGAQNFYLGPFLPEGMPWEGDNSTTVTDQAILALNLVQKHPELLEHTQYSQYVLKPGTYLEYSYSTYNYSLAGSYYPLPGMDGIKTGSSDTAAFNVATTAKRDNLRLVEVVFGVGDWGNGDSEHFRSQISNALMEQAFTRYEHRLILTKGEHEIDGEKVIVLEDLYDTLPRGEEPSFERVSDHIRVQAERTYLPGFEAPAVAYELVNPPIETPIDVVTEEEPNDAPSDPPASNANLKQRILTISLYLLGAFIVLLVVRSLLVRTIRRRINRRQRTKK